MLTKLHRGSMLLESWYRITKLKSIFLLIAAIQKLDESVTFSEKTALTVSCKVLGIFTQGENRKTANNYNSTTGLLSKTL